MLEQKLGTMVPTDHQLTVQTPTEGPAGHGEVTL